MTELATTLLELASLIAIVVGVWLLWGGPWALIAAGLIGLLVSSRVARPAPTDEAT